MKILPFVSLLFIIVFAKDVYGQTADTVKTSTMAYKAGVITERLASELSLSTNQVAAVKKLMMDRLISINSVGLSNVATVNDKFIKRLNVILSDEQIQTYRQIRDDDKRQKNSYLKKHPEYKVSDEDTLFDF